MGVQRLSLLSNCQNTLIKHAFSTNQSAHYVWTFLYTHLTLAWTIDKGRGLYITHKIFFLACEQALRGALAAGREKEGELAPTCLEFEYLHRKSRCEKLIGGDDISNDLSCVFQCFFTFALVSASLWLTETDSSIDVDSQGNWWRNSNSRNLVASSPSFARPADRAPRIACS